MNIKLVTKLVAAAALTAGLAASASPAAAVITRDATAAAPVNSGTDFGSPTTRRATVVVRNNLVFGSADVSGVTYSFTNTVSVNCGALGWSAPIPEGGITDWDGDVPYISCFGFLPISTVRSVLDVL